MRNIRSSALAAALALSACSPGKTATPPQPTSGTNIPDFPTHASKQWIVTPRGVGAVQFGMTLAQARAALGDSLTGAPSDGSCGVVRPAGAPPGLSLLIEGGTVVRADVDSTNVATDHGAMVGMSEVEVGARHGDSVTAMPHKYQPNGHNLTFAPPVAGEPQYRVVFETDGVRVLRFHAGIMPAVEYVERCG